MNRYVSSALIFMIGAVSGSVLTHLLIKKKYAHLADEEISSVREVYERREEKIKSESLSENANKAMNEYCTTDADDYSDCKPIDIHEDGIPYVISPLQFGENDTYECVSLTYLSNNVLTDECNEIIENVEAVVGDALEHFGEYEDDCVHVCNDRLKCYYEILKD